MTRPLAKMSYERLCLLFAILFEFVAALGAPDNAGTEFILIYTENAADTFSADLELYVTTPYQDDVIVNVTSPLRSQNGINEEFVVRAGYVHRLFMPYDMRLIGSGKSANTILVQAENEVVVYTVNKETYTNDAYLALPTDVLGHQYFTVSYHPATYETQFAVAATYACIVTITLPNPLSFIEVLFEGTTYVNGDSFTVSLSMFESFQIQSKGDLTGTSVSSTKPIAVFSGNRRTRVDGYSTDHLAEQLPPVATWGKTFAIVPTPNRTVGDFVKCVASEGGTSLTVSNNYGTYSIGHAGESLQVSINSGDFVSIIADKPILVVQIVKSQETATSEEKADPAMSVIYPIEQFSAECTLSTPEYSQDGSYTNVLIIAVKDSERTGLRLDHQPLDMSTVWTPFAALNYSGAQIPITHGSHTIYHVNPTVTFGGILYGYAMYEAFSLPLGVRLAPVNSPCTNTPTLIGDGLDNDCDGLIDEEICASDNIDDDGDGRLDEDCAKPVGHIMGTTDDTQSPLHSMTVTEILVTSTAVRNPELTDISGTTSDMSNSSTWTSYPDFGPSQLTPEQDQPKTSFACPVGWFSCDGSGSAHCLQNSFLCDCAMDCPGGWDEEPALAGCKQTHPKTCHPDSGVALEKPLVILLVFGLLAVFKATPVQ